MLNLDVSTIVFQIINFAVLALLLNRFLFQPVLRRAAERAAEKERLLKELAEEKESASSLRADLEQRLANGDQEAGAIVAQGREQAERERQELLAQARTEAEQLFARAQADATRLTQQAVDEFHERLLEAVLEVSGNLINRVAPPELHEGLVNRLSERIWEMGRTEMQRVEAFRRSLGEREPVAYVTSALKLSVEQQGQLARTLTALADRHVNMDLRIDPELAAGVRVRLGDMVVDNSLAARLQELRGEVLTALKEQIKSA